MATITALQKPQPSPVEQLLNPASHPTYNFAFSDFLKREYRFGLDRNRPTCKAFLQGHCPLGGQCPDKHDHQSNYNKYAMASVRTRHHADIPHSLVCKHWLRGLCKKGDSCEFQHSYNLRSMPECAQFSRHLVCSNGSECLYLHLDPALKQPPCASYERGFCPLGPYCAARHEKKKTFCKYYMAGFCPDGRDCKEGVHPKWKEEKDMRKPDVKRPLSDEAQEAERERLIEKLERQREEQERRFEERGRGDGGGRGRGRGRGGFRGRGRGGDRY
jgi:cleavage and polyadenylation specificity factor subunit 4